MQNLILQQSIQPYIYSAFLSAVESNQIVIVCFLLEQWLATNPSSLSNEHLNSVFQLAYQLNHKELLIVLIEFLSKLESYSKTFKPLFQFISLLNNQTQPPPPSSLFDHLVSLSSKDYISHNNIQTYLEILRDPTQLLSSTSTPDSLFKNDLFKKFPIVIPPTIVQELELSLENSQQPKHEKHAMSFILLCWKIRWSVFVDDFEFFQTNLTDFNILWQRLAQSFSITNLFEFLVARTIERNLRIDFFNHCLFMIKKKLKSGDFTSLIGLNDSLNRSAMRIIEFKRIDLFREIINLPESLFSITPNFPIALAKYGTIEMLKEFVFHNSRDFSFNHRCSIETAISAAMSRGNYENVDFLFNLPKSKSGTVEINMTLIGETLVLYGDLDLLKQFSKKHNFEKHWEFMLKDAIGEKDIEAVNYILTNLMKNNDEKVKYVAFLNTMLPRTKNEVISIILKKAIEKWSSQ